MKLVLLYLMWCEDEAPAKLVNNIYKELQKRNLEIYCLKSHFSQLKYLTQTMEKESQLIGEVHLLLYATYIESFTEKDLKYKFEYWTSLFSLICFSGKTSNKFKYRVHLI